MTPEIRAKTIQEWNDLGFWYDFTPEQGWVIRGSRAGFEKFAALLDRYAADPRNAQVSEHEHLGPYMYLKVVTWSSPEINHDGIYGSSSDMFRFATLIRECTASCQVGDQFKLAQSFSVASSSELTLVCESGVFSPGDYDAQLQE